MLKNFFVAMAIILSILSCSDKKENGILSEPRYRNLSDSIEQAPGNDSLHYRRGTLLFKEGHFELAEKDIQKAWELNPTEKYALSIATLRKELNGDVIGFLESASKKFPNSPFLLIELAYQYHEKKRGDKVMEICNQLIEMYPNNIDALLLKSSVLKEQGMDQEALRVMETAYQYAPGDAELAHNLAFEYAESKNPKALKIADSLIGVDTEKSHAEPYYFKGVYFSNTGQPAEAVRQFDLAISTNHNFIEAYINKGIIYFDQKKYSQALDVFLLAARVSPDEAFPYYWIGKTQQALGKLQDAKTNYQRAFGLDKNLTNARDSAAKL